MKNFTWGALKMHYLMPEHSIMLCILIIASWFACTWPIVLFIASFNNSALYINVYGSYMLFFSLCWFLCALGMVYICELIIISASHTSTIIGKKYALPDYFAQEWLTWPLFQLVLVLIRPLLRVANMYWERQESIFSMKALFQVDRAIPFNKDTPLLRNCLTNWSPKI